MARMDVKAEFEDMGDNKESLTFFAATAATAVVLVASSPTRTQQVPASSLMSLQLIEDVECTPPQHHFLQQMGPAKTPRTRVTGTEGPRYQAESQKRSDRAAQGQLMDTCNGGNSGPRKRARWGQGSSKQHIASSAHNLTWGDGKLKMNGSGRFKKLS
jgi:hypothetical protein